MKKFLLFSITVMAGFALSHAAVNITFSGLMFSPANDTIKQSDTVIFTLSSIHSALEVSQATYNAEGTTPLPQGFSVPFGGGKLSASGLAAGIHYFVCMNHASSGMRGTLFVQSVTAINPASNDAGGFTFQVAGAKAISFNISGESAQLSVLNIQGRKVWSMNMGKNGFRNFSWDGKLANGRNLSAGTYFIQLTTLDASQKPIGRISRTLIELH